MLRPSSNHGSLWLHNDDDAVYVFVCACGRVNVCILGPMLKKPNPVLLAQIPRSSLAFTPRSYSRRSPHFLSTIPYSDLSSKRPNHEYAQERAQRRTQTNKDGS